MSVLLVAPPEDLGRILVERLLGQDDDVRVIEPLSDRKASWRELGAHVAGGEISADLVERAGQNVRTVVIFGSTEPTEILEGARNARVDRVVLCAGKPDPATLEGIEGSDLDYVILVTGRLRRRNLAAVAAAIDAADDLPGGPRMVVDLRSRAARNQLKLNEEF